MRGFGLNLTAWSYADDLFVSILSCPASLPDPWCVVDALDELMAKSGRSSRDVSEPRASVPAARPSHPATVTVICPGTLIVIVPPQSHMQVESAVSAGLSPMVTVGDPGVHGADVIGTHG